MKQILTLIIVTIIVLQGCNDHKIQNDKAKQANLLKTNNIRAMVVHEIWFDRSGKQALKRIAWQECFNEFGFLIQRVTPKYKEKTLKDINRKKVGDISDYLTKKVETSSATGFSDTTFYFYNNKNQLIKQNSVSHKSDGSYYGSTQSTNEYDDYGNMVKSCHISDMFLGGKGCNFTLLSGR